MKSPYKPKKRKRKSKFDPYIVEIAKYLAMGMTIQETAELIEYHFDDVVNRDALYVFMRSRGLQSMVTMGGTNSEYEAPCCGECDSCLTVTNTNKSEARVCLTAKRMISKSCHTSPIWCEKRGESVEISKPKKERSNQ
jgi:hypothetical protein